MMAPSLLLFFYFPKEEKKKKKKINSTLAFGSGEGRSCC